MGLNPKEIIEKIDSLGYVIDEELATVLFLMFELKKPLLLEGNPGVGKTQIASIIATLNDLDLIRLQCYEGLDVNNAIYEWNYQKQLLGIKLHQSRDASIEEQEEMIFSQSYLLKRPLLQAIDADKQQVLLIDEVDRSDEEFEAFLLELLSDFQISIPELGTIKAKHNPIVILTSNRTRELSDALKRRCLYHWVEYPDPEKELKIIKKHIPHIDEQLAQQIVEYVEKIRLLKLDKSPGIAETIDWAKGIASFDQDAAPFQKALSCLLKSDHDMRLVKEEIFN